MTQPRSKTVNPNEVGIYHCFSRCVRRAFLCGYDSYSKKDYEHRRQWAYDRLKFLSKVFAVDVLAFAIMGNHSHALLRIRPDLVKSMSDREVAIRWRTLYPKGPRNSPDDPPSEMEIMKLYESQEQMTELRKRICSLSWFMKSLNEYIARSANEEDQCTGSFWDGRFKDVKMVDESACLACSVYIDLNPIRAKLAETPETSHFTSIKERIEMLTNNPDNPEKNSWISPISNNDKKMGFLSIGLKEYIRLVDETGRQLKRGKAGAIPPDLCPILERINIKPNKWLKTTSNFREMFAQVSGRSTSMIEAAQKAGGHWHQGINAAREVFN